MSSASHVSARGVPAALAVATAAALLLAVLLLFQRQAAISGYLVALAFWLHLSLGSLGVLSLHGLTGGRWGRYLAADLRAAAATLPVVLLLSLPIALARGGLYPPAAGETLPYDTGMWLAPAALALRGALYAAAWLAAAALLGVFARDGNHVSGARAVIAAMLLVVSTTFYAIDWLAGVQPLATSSATGFILVPGLLAGGLAFGLLAACLRGEGGGDERRDAANLLLGFLLLFAYALTMKFLVVWLVNLPSEIAWYLARNNAAMAVSFLAAAVVVPVALLVSPAVKRSRRALLLVAAIALAGRQLDALWWLWPVVGKTAATAAAVAVSLPAIGGAWIAAWLVSRRRQGERA